MATRNKQSGPDATRVTIRLGGDKEPIEFHPDPATFQTAAMQWSYVARTRERWRTDGQDPAQGEGGPLQSYLSADDIDRIARAEIVEVSLPGSVIEERGWEYRVFPWEYVLSAITRTRRSRSLTIIRHLRVEGASADASVRLQRPAIVESAPLRLAQFYDARREGDLMLKALGFDPAKVKERLRDPTLDDLERWLGSTQPSLLHLAGVDTHQAIALLGLERKYPSRARRDGYAMRSADPDEPMAIADADALAQAICATSKPDLVMCNFYNSASRVAARMVAHGAKMAIGYHDAIDDSMAALFCTSLYGQLAEGRSVLEAFGHSLATLRQQDILRGAGVVLWSSVSLLQAKTRVAKSRVPRPRNADEVSARERIQVRVEPLPLINYSLLHNGQSPFSSLVIERARVQGPIRDIQVSIELHAGDVAFPYNATFDLPEERSALVLTDRVVLPLTSTLIRTQSERIQSSLRVAVHCGGELVTQETHRVGLAPVDEWQDGELAEWRWLPSFVLPRDPAVARIVDSAQAILCALADDTAAGFDGYQSVDENGADDDARYGCVDKQVQALWYAILNQHGLTYINPPPSYGQGTQRLRTPSQLLAERRGTCIDLALLLAACLEYVGISPVLFLLSGHAFAGYWRSEASYESFRSVPQGQVVAVKEGSDDRGAGSTLNNPKGVVGKDQQREVQRHIHLGHLVPLEATWLTSRGSFQAAAEEGRHNVRSADYQAMIDLRLSRDLGVTPLPLLGAAP
ncbi:hypothetical protein [Ideonella sp.]|uniref:hypothetical protein n=1 Tax=Ideonella sp. TaxID=1929293 RepID=UPI0035B0F2E4